jgi:transposase
VVGRVLGQAGLIEMQPTRPLLIQSFVPFNTETLQKCPRLPASRLFEMVRQRGYTGRPNQFREHVSRMRPPKVPAVYLRLKTLKGEQAQVDWAHFGKIIVGRAARCSSDPTVSARP